MPVVNPQGSGHAAIALRQPAVDGNSLRTTALKPLGQSTKLTTRTRLPASNTRLHPPQAYAGAAPPSQSARAPSEQEPAQPSRVRVCTECTTAAHVLYHAATCSTMLQRVVLRNLRSASLGACGARTRRACGVRRQLRLAMDAPRHSKSDGPERGRGYAVLLDVATCVVGLRG